MTAQDLLYSFLEGPSPKTKRVSKRSCLIVFQGVPYVEANGMSSLYKLQVNIVHKIWTFCDSLNSVTKCPQSRCK